MGGYIKRRLIEPFVMPIAFAALVLPVEPLVGTLFLVSAPLIPVFMALVGWGAEAASRRQIQAFARLSGFFADRQFDPRPFVDRNGVADDEIGIGDIRHDWFLSWQRSCRHRRAP